jgi:hypothetical protein
MSIYDNFKLIDELLNGDERLIENDISNVAGLAVFDKMNPEDQYNLVKEVSSTIMPRLRARMPELLKLIPSDKVINFPSMSIEFNEQELRSELSSFTSKNIIEFLSKEIKNKIFVYDYKDIQDISIPFEENPSLEEKIYNNWIDHLLTGSKLVNSDDIVEHLYLFVADTILETQDSSTQEELSELVTNLLNDTISSIGLNIEKDGANIESQLNYLFDEINSDQFKRDIVNNLTYSDFTEGRGLYKYIEDKVFFFLMDGFKVHLLSLISSKHCHDIIDDLESLYIERQSFIELYQLEDLTSLTDYGPFQADLNQIETEFTLDNYDKTDMRKSYSNLSLRLEELLEKRNEIGQKIRDSYEKDSKKEVSYQKSKEETKTAIDLIDMDDNDGGGVSIVKNLKSNFKFRIAELKTDIKESIIKDLFVKYTPIKNEVKKILNKIYDLKHAQFELIVVSKNTKILSEIAMISFDINIFKSKMKHSLCKLVEADSELFFSDRLNNVLNSKEYFQEMESLLTDSISGIKIKVSDTPASSFISTVITESAEELAGGALSTLIPPALASTAGLATITAGMAAPVIGVIVAMSVLKATIKGLAHKKQNNEDKISKITDQLASMILKELNEKKVELIAELI